jgi:oligosaccharide repeat unit polymerase
MIQDFTELFKIIAGTALIFGVLFLIYRKHILHIFDPLFYYLVAQSFSIELGFLIIEDKIYLFNFLACELCFILGFFSLVGKTLKAEDRKLSKLFTPSDQLNLSVVKWYALFGLAVIIIANIILIKIQGIALLSDNPSAAKVDNFSEGGGLGVIRRINWGMLYLVGLCMLTLYLLKKDIGYVLLFLLLLLVPISSGSKGALLYFVYAVTLLSCFGDIKNSGSFAKLRTGSYVLLVFAIFLSTVLISNGETSDSFTDKIFKLATRFLYFGDAIIYYYNHDSVQHFASYNAVDFFKDELNPVLGFFRLVPYQQPMGFRIINYYFNVNSQTFGPNTPYYIKGNIYFGYYGAFIYSYIIGAIIGFMRGRFYAIVRNGSSLLYAIIIVHLNLAVYTLAQDSQLFVSVLFDTFILSLPFFIISVWLHFSKKTSLA